MNVMSLVAMLADHWKKAGTGDNVGSEYPAAYRVPSFPRRQAVKYLKLLGDQSLQNFSLDEACKLHGEALKIADETAALSAERGPLQRRIGRSYFLKGNLSSARELLELALISNGCEQAR